MRRFSLDPHSIAILRPICSIAFAPSRAGCAALLLALVVVSCSSGSEPPRGASVPADGTARAAPSAETTSGGETPADRADRPLRPEELHAAERFFAGQTITIVVGSGPGGGFDTTARIVARHMPKHIPGQPTVIVQNMPGAGGLVAASHLSHTAPRNGLVFGIFPENQLMHQLVGTEGVRLDLRQLNWIGSSFVSPNVCLVRSDAPVRTFAEMVKSRTPLAFGATGRGSSTYDVPRVIAETTGANLRAVTGYSTTSDVRLGIERGEIHGMCLGLETAQSTVGPWLRDGYVRIFVQNGDRPHPDLPDVPLARDFATDAESALVLKLVDAAGGMAKPFALPPGVDPARVEVLRRALSAAYDDPAFREEAKQMQLDFYPKTASEVRPIVDDVLSTPPNVVARYKRIIDEG
jgi:tripartite-type tricarboxylate transporter receptor subunit TctC